MYIAPSKEPKSGYTGKTEKHPDSSLIKLFGQLRNALTDPSTAQRAMDGIAGLAIGTVPKLGQYLGEIAQDADMRKDILNNTSHLTGYQGPSLHDQADIADRIRQLEEKLNNSNVQTTFPDFSKEQNNDVGGMPTNQGLPNMPIQTPPKMPEEMQMPTMPTGMSQPGIGMSQPSAGMPQPEMQGF
jgi:hypothetical protein